MANSAMTVYVQHEQGVWIKNNDIFDPLGKIEARADVQIFGFIPC